MLDPGPRLLKCRDHMHGAPLEAPMDPWLAFVEISTSESEKLPSTCILGGCILMF